jgi:hypothetical protein
MATQIGEIARRVGGHGGMDFIMDYRLIHCLRNGLPWIRTFMMRPPGRASSN